MLEELAPDLWVEQQSLRFAGIDVGTRMTVVRLRQQELLLHSPVAPRPELREALGALGEVRYLVAPNRFHHLFVGEYAAHYPKSQLFVAPGLPRKRPDLTVHAVLEDEAPSQWEGQLDQQLFRGYPLANEIVFFHRASSTLIASDLALNIGPGSPPATRLVARLLRAYGRFGPSLMERVGIRDRAAARESLRRILEWDFERVIIAHGRILDRGGRRALRDGYAWLW